MQLVPFGIPIYTSLSCLFTHCFDTSGNRASSNHLVLNQSSAATMGRTPVYFFSHGGPTIMESTGHPAHQKLRELGLEITQKIQPKAIVVFSAHWQGEPNLIEVNTATTRDLIYDFYGFPPHFYEYKFPNTGSPELAERIMGLFGEAGIKSEGVRRGLDHGVWASFMCAFNPETNPLKVPIVQVSLFDSDDPDKHFRLGEAIQKLRKEGVLIIVSGMAVHNLGEMRAGFRSDQPSAPMPYTLTFSAALKEAVEKGTDERQQAMAELLKRPDARKAHPSKEHLLPVHIGAGAAGTDLGKQIYALPDGSLGWDMYRFGEVGA